MDHSLELLLDLDGTVLVQTDAGHWILIRAVRTPPTPERPHGIRYSLTFHGPDNVRLLGYDNAHGTPRRRVPFDHRHRRPGDIGTPYRFETAEKLMRDFFKDVDIWLENNHD